MAELPSGTVSFLFTDLEGSTRLWEEHPGAMRPALARHDEILREAVVAHNGNVVKSTGDGIHAVFTTADGAVRAALDAQIGLAGENWAATGPLRVRMGLHTGEAEQRDGDYYGSGVNRAARLMAAAHGGQIVVSQATASVLSDELPDRVELLDLGEHRLRDLTHAERVFQVAHPDLPREFARLQSLDAAPGNLPLPTSSFVGREREASAVTGALLESRVVTLTGFGGVGKTRLALRVASSLRSEHRDGAWLCELADVRDPDAVADAVLGAFDATRRPGTTATSDLLELLNAKELLLVLDNCEHLLDPVARLVTEIERSCPGVHVLATSREGLDVDGERILAVSSLATPDADDDYDALAASDGVRLFVERAKAATSDFALTPANAGAVAQLCRRLDGIPLAIELAAARAQAFTPAELLSRLDRRFELLTGGRRTAVERHQTLRATLDWSYQLLDHAERLLLARLGVFVGGFSLPAAEDVTGGHGVDRDLVWDLLARVISRSLVVVDHDATDTRYRLLDTIRQYALDRLDESDDGPRVRHEHARFFASFAEAAVPALWTPEEVEWTTRIDREVDNIRAAIDWAIASDDCDIALQILSMSCSNATPWCSRFNPTIAPVARAAIELPGASGHDRYAAALAAAAFLVLTWQEDYEAAGRFATTAIETDPSSNSDAVAYAWIVRSNVAMATDGPDDYIAAWERGVEIMRACASPNLGAALAFLAALRCAAGDWATAAAEADEALTLARRQGAPGVISIALATVGWVFADSDPSLSIRRVREAMAVERTRGPNSGNMTVAIAADVAARNGTRREGLEVYLDAMERLRWGAIGPGLYPILGSVAELLAADEPESAAILFGGVAKVVAVTKLVGDQAARRTRTITALEEVLGEERLAELQDLGAGMSDADLVSCARDAIAGALTK